MTEKLKPCPFCGGEAKIHNTYDGMFQIECTNCFARVFYDRTKKSVINRWNRRVDNAG
jgi:Lar family restriction alleviation protein